MPACKNDSTRRYAGTEPSPKGDGWCAHGEDVGKMRTGTDKKKWTVTKISNGSKRWVKVNASSPKASPKAGLSTPTVAAMKALLKKHHVVNSHGSKSGMAAALLKVRGRALPDSTLETILPLLCSKAATKVRKLLQKRAANPVTRYRGMWRPRPKPLSAMSRSELMANLRSFRNAWERVTTRNQDMSNADLEATTMARLRSLLNFYYSEHARVTAEGWLRRLARNERRDRGS